MEKLIGDYKGFFSELLSNLQKKGIQTKGMPVSHLCYRTTSKEEYENLRGQIKKYCNYFVETQFKGRAVSLLQLKTPLSLSAEYSTSLIELPAPREGRPYKSGLEHAGFVVGDKLEQFKKQYRSVLTGEKDRDYYTIPFITFESGITAKLYERPLKEIVESEGWKFSEIVI